MDECPHKLPFKCNPLLPPCNALITTRLLPHKQLICKVTCCGLCKNKKLLVNFNDLTYAFRHTPVKNTITRPPHPGAAVGILPSSVKVPVTSRRRTATLRQPAMVTVTSASSVSFGRRTCGGCSWSQSGSGLLGSARLGWCRFTGLVGVSQLLLWVRSPRHRGGSQEPNGDTRVTLSN